MIVSLSNPWIRSMISSFFSSRNSNCVSWCLCETPCFDRSSESRPCEEITRKRKEKGQRQTDEGRCFDKTTKLHAVIEREKLSQDEMSGLCGWSDLLVEVMTVVVRIKKIMCRTVRAFEEHQDLSHTTALECVCPHPSRILWTAPVELWHHGPHLVDRPFNVIKHLSKCLLFSIPPRSDLDHRLTRQEKDRKTDPFKSLDLFLFLVFFFCNRKTIR